MPVHWLWTAARSLLVGWAALIATTYLLQRFLLPLVARWTGAHWISTIRLALACLALAATGWLIGRSHRTHPMASVLIFAATLLFFDLDPLVGINVPWLFRLSVDAFHDSRYFESLAFAVGQQVVLFSSLIAGALCSRPATPPVSITAARSDL